MSISNTMLLLSFRTSKRLGCYTRVPWMSRIRDCGGHHIALQLRPLSCGFTAVCVVLLRAGRLMLRLQAEAKRRLRRLGSDPGGPVGPPRVSAALAHSVLHGRHSSASHSSAASHSLAVLQGVALASHGVPAPRGAATERATTQQRPLQRLQRAAPERTVGGVGGGAAVQQAYIVSPKHGHTAAAAAAAAAVCAAMPDFPMVLPAPTTTPSSPTAHRTAQGMPEVPNRSSPTQRTATLAATAPGTLGGSPSSSSGPSSGGPGSGNGGSSGGGGGAPFLPHVAPRGRDEQRAGHGAASPYAASGRAVRESS